MLEAGESTYAVKKVTKFRKTGLIFAWTPGKKFKPDSQAYYK